MGCNCAGVASKTGALRDWRSPKCPKHFAARVSATTVPCRSSFSWRFFLSGLAWLSAASPSHEGTRASTDPFKTTDDYIRGCDSAKPPAACAEDYAAARRKLMVKAMVGEAIKTCAPSDRIPVRSLVAWLKEHPQPANQKYLDGLQAAMVGLSNSSYKCK